jgi:hypothetical protein
MNRLRSFLALALCAVSLAAAETFTSGPGWLDFPGGKGPGAGKTVVLLAGDEEYRSEESMPMLARLLAERHGFRCVVLFSHDADGTINPNNGASLGKPEALDGADALVCTQGGEMRQQPIGQQAIDGVTPLGAVQHQFGPAVMAVAFHFRGWGGSGHGVPSQGAVRPGCRQRGSAHCTCAVRACRSRNKGRQTAPWLW